MSGVEFVAETPAAAAPPPMTQQPQPASDTEVAAAHPQRLGRRSLTSRLVVGVAALAVVLVAIIGGGTYYALRVFLLNRLDSQLGVASRQIVTFFEDCLHNDPVLTPNGQMICRVTGPVTPQHDGSSSTTAAGRLLFKATGTSPRCS